MRLDDGFYNTHTKQKKNVIKVKIAAVSPPREAIVECYYHFYRRTFVYIIITRCYDIVQESKWFFNDNCYII